jgi:methionyl-tRNA formyltransferase
MGVQAMLEAADLVMAGKHKEIVQNEAAASYEGWCRAAEAKIAWATHVDFVYDLIRGTNPAPGAWTTLNGKRLQIFDARKHLFRTFGAVKGKPGEVSEVTATSVFVTAQGGRIEVLKAKADDGKKASAPEVAAALGSRRTLLGTDRRAPPEETPAGRLFIPTSDSVAARQRPPKAGFAFFPGARSSRG